jgi:hypothetical protein
MDLGALVGEYPVDNRRRGRIGLVLTVAGAAAVAVGVPLMIAEVNRPLGPGEPTSTGPDKVIGGHLVGIDFRCAVRRHDGRRFAFSSHTTDATELATALHDAVHDGKPPRRTL